MKWLLIGIFFFYSLAVSAVEHNNSLNCKKNLQHLLSSINTMRADFEQISYTEKNNIHQKKQGYLIAKRPGNILWVTKSPLEQHIIADNKNIWIYDPDLEQATVSKFSQDLIRNPAILFIGSIENAELSYDINCTGIGPIDFVLTPINTNSLYEKIELSFENKVPLSIKLWDSLGYRSEIYLIKTQLNRVVENKNFQFDLPEGVDVIRHK